MRSLSLALLSLLLLIPSLSTAEEIHPLDIGAKAPDFDLMGVDDKRYALHDFDSAKILMVIFTSNHCPTAQAYESRIKQMAADYKDKGVALVAINPNNPGALTLDELRYSDLNDSLEEMKVRARDQKFNFPYLYDGEEQKAAHAYGCLATPHVFIFDQDRKLRYQGRIDDSDVKTIHHTDARNALDALLAGQTVPVEKTHVFGCSTKWAEKSANVKRTNEKWDAEPVELNPIEADAVTKLAANDSKKLRLINVWATWCAPCVAEMPDLLAIHRTYRTRGLEVVTLSIDEPDSKDKVLSFLKDHHLSTVNYFWSSDDKDALVKSLDKQWDGPVPFTLLIAPGGKVLYRSTGAFDTLALKRAIVSYLGRTY